MKANKIELDLDFIGGQGSLTKTEEKELNDFFKSRKLTTRSKTIRQQVGTNTCPNVVT